MYIVSCRRTFESLQARIKNSSQRPSNLSSKTNLSDYNRKFYSWKLDSTFKLSYPLSFQPYFPSPLPSFFKHRAFPSLSSESPGLSLVIYSLLDYQHGKSIDHHQNTLNKSVTTNFLQYDHSIPSLIHLIFQFIYSNQPYRALRLWKYMINHQEIMSNRHLYKVALDLLACIRRTRWHQVIDFDHNSTGDRAETHHHLEDWDKALSIYSSWKLCNPSTNIPPLNFIASLLQCAVIAGDWNFCLDLQSTIHQHLSPPTCSSNSLKPGQILTSYLFSHIMRRLGKPKDAEYYSKLSLDLIDLAFKNPSSANANSPLATPTYNSEPNYQLEGTLEKAYHPTITFIQEEILTLLEMADRLGDPFWIPLFLVHRFHLVLPSAPLKSYARWRRYYEKLIILAINNRLDSVASDLISTWISFDPNDVLIRFLPSFVQFIARKFGAPYARYMYDGLAHYSIKHEKGCGLIFRELVAIMMDVYMDEQTHGQAIEMYKTYERLEDSLQLTERNVRYRKRDAKLKQRDVEQRMEKIDEWDEFTEIKNELASISNSLESPPKQLDISTFLKTLIQKPLLSHNYHINNNINRILPSRSILQSYRHPSTLCPSLCHRLVNLFISQNQFDEAQHILDSIFQSTLFSPFPQITLPLDHENILVSKFSLVIRRHGPEYASKFVIDHWGKYHILPPQSVMIELLKSHVAHQHIHQALKLFHQLSNVDLLNSDSYLAISSLLSSSSSLEWLLQALEKMQNHVCQHHSASSYDLYKTLVHAPGPKILANIMLACAGRYNEQSYALGLRLLERILPQLLCSPFSDHGHPSVSLSRSNHQSILDQSLLLYSLMLFSIQHQVLSLVHLIMDFVQRSTNYGTCHERAAHWLTFALGLGYLGERIHINSFCEPWWNPNAKISDCNDRPFASCDQEYFHDDVEQGRGKDDAKTTLHLSKSAFIDPSKWRHLISIFLPEDQRTIIHMMLTGLVHGAHWNLARQVVFHHNSPLFQFSQNYSPNLSFSISPILNLQLEILLHNGSLGQAICVFQMMRRALQLTLTQIVRADFSKAFSDHLDYGQDEFERQFVDHPSHHLSHHFNFAGEKKSGTLEIGKKIKSRHGLSHYWNPANYGLLLLRPSLLSPSTQLTRSRKLPVYIKFSPSFQNAGSKLKQINSCLEDSTNNGIALATPSSYEMIMMHVFKCMFQRLFEESKLILDMEHHILHHRGALYYCKENLDRALDFRACTFIQFKENVKKFGLCWIAQLNEEMHDFCMKQPLNIRMIMAYVHARKYNYEKSLNELEEILMLQSDPKQATLKKLLFGHALNPAEIKTSQTSFIHPRLLQFFHLLIELSAERRQFNFTSHLVLFLTRFNLSPTHETLNLILFATPTHRLYAMLQFLISNQPFEPSQHTLACIVDNMLLLPHQLESIGNVLFFLHQFSSKHALWPSAETLAFVMRKMHFHFRRRFIPFAIDLSMQALLSSLLSEGITLSHHVLFISQLVYYNVMNYRQHLSLCQTLIYWWYMLLPNEYLYLTPLTKVMINNVINDPYEELAEGIREEWQERHRNESIHEDEHGDDVNPSVEHTYGAFGAQDRLFKTNSEHSSSLANSLLEEEEEQVLVSCNLTAIEHDKTQWLTKSCQELIKIIEHLIMKTRPNVKLTPFIISPFIFGTSTNKNVNLTETTDPLAFAPRLIQMDSTLNIYVPQLIDLLGFHAQDHQTPGEDEMRLRHSLTTSVQPSCSIAVESCPSPSSNIPKKGKHEATMRQTYSLYTTDPIHGHDHYGVSPDHDHG